MEINLYKDKVVFIEVEIHIRVTIKKEIKVFQDKVIKIEVN